MKRILEFLKFFLPIVVLAVVLIYFNQSSQDNEQNLDPVAENTSNSYGSLVKFDPEKTEPGFVLYPSVGDYKVRILNMKGEVVHVWDVDAVRARLLEDCSLLVAHGSKKGQDHKYWKKLTNTVRKYSWDGDVIWEYNNAQRIHHDIRLTKEGNYIFPLKLMLDADLFREHRDIPKKIKQIKSDEIIEVNPEGEELWRWSAHKRLNLATCGLMQCSEHHNQSGWTHVNTVAEIPENKWYDQGDERFKPGNIIIMLRNWWQPIIVDKETGETVWSYQGDYRGGLSGGHEAIMIEKGYPGAGNILIFDNGRKTHQGESIVLEINPTNNELVWKYEDGKKFFSHSAGMAQRLKNANTFISQDEDGYRAFEVTPEGEIVWEFKGIRRTARAHKYPADHCPNLTTLKVS